MSQNEKIIRLVHGVMKDVVSLGDSASDPITQIHIGEVVKIEQEAPNQPLSWGVFNIWVKPNDGEDPYIFSRVLTHEYVTLFSQPED